MNRPTHNYNHVGSVHGSMKQMSIYGRKTKENRNQCVDSVSGELVPLPSDLTFLDLEEEEQIEMRECFWVAPHSIGNNPIKYWNYVDRRERKGGDIRKFELGKYMVQSFPNDLSHDQCIMLTEKIAKMINNDYGWSIADEKYYTPTDAQYHGTPDNKHAHFLFGDRAVSLRGKHAKRKNPNTRNSFSRKERVKFEENRIKPVGDTRRDFVENIRKKAAEIINVELKKMGLKLIDHRSYERQGVDLVPCQYIPKEHFQKCKDSGHRLLNFRKLTNKQKHYERSEKQDLRRLGEHEKTVARERSGMVRMGEKQVQTLREIGDDIELRKRKADARKRRSDRGERAVEKPIGSSKDTLDRRVVEALERERKSTRRAGRAIAEAEQSIRRSGEAMRDYAKTVSRSKIEAAKSELIGGPLFHMPNAAQILDDSQESVLSDFNDYLGDWDEGRFEQVFKWKVASEYHDEMIALYEEVVDFVYLEDRDYPMISNFTNGRSYHGFGFIDSKKKEDIESFLIWMSMNNKPFSLAVAQEPCEYAEEPIDVEDFDPIEDRERMRREQAYWDHLDNKQKSYSEIPKRLTIVFGKSAENLERVINEGRYEEMLEGKGRNLGKGKKQSLNDREPQPEIRKEILLGR